MKSEAKVVLCASVMNWNRNIAPAIFRRQECKEETFVKNPIAAAWTHGYTRTTPDRKHVESFGVRLTHAGTRYILMKVCTYIFIFIQNACTRLGHDSQPTAM